MRWKDSRSRRSHLPQTEVQFFIVHLVHSLNSVPWKSRDLVAGNLRRIYQAVTAEEARQKLEEMILNSISCSIT